MNQPTPKVGRSDVERAVRRDFPKEEVADVLKALAEYGTEEYHREKERVQLAVLKLAGGSRTKLRHELEGAKCDYRDALGAAEYPRYTKKAFRAEKMPEEERLMDADWKQYTDWLTR